MPSKSVNNQDTNSRVIIIKDGSLQVNKGLKSGDTGKKATNCVLGDKDCIISPTHSCDQQGFIKRYNAEHLTYLLMKKTLRHGEKLNS